MWQRIYINNTWVYITCVVDVEFVIRYVVVKVLTRRQIKTDSLPRFRNFSLARVWRYNVVGAIAGITSTTLTTPYHIHPCGKRAISMPNLAPTPH